MTLSLRNNLLISTLRRVPSRLHLSDYFLTRSLPYSSGFSHFVSFLRVPSRLHLSCCILTRSLQNSNVFSIFVSFSQFCHKTSRASDFKKVQEQLFIALKLRKQTLKGSKTFLFHLIVVTFILSCV